MDGDYTINQTSVPRKPEHPLETCTRKVAQIPEETLTRQRPQHNPHQMAWQPVREDEPATLAYFIRDYVGHLRHHLEQIRSLAREG